MDIIPEWYIITEPDHRKLAERFIPFANKWSVYRPPEYMWSISESHSNELATVVVCIKNATNPTLSSLPEADNRITDDSESGQDPSGIGGSCTT